MKNAIIIGVILVLVGSVVWWGIWDSGQKTEIENIAVSPDATVYYYGEECPHCKNIAQYLEENNVADRVAFEKKEVWHDKRNAAEMQSAAEMCDIPSDKLGVPFVFSKGKCFIGEPGVKGFFESQM